MLQNLKCKLGIHRFNEWKYFVRPCDTIAKRVCQNIHCLKTETKSYRKDNLSGAPDKEKAGR